MVLENKCVDLSLFFLFWAIVFPSLDGSEIVIFTPPAPPPPPPPTAPKKIFNFVILGLPFENEEQIWACSVRST
jgi:hypothetical protein